MNLALANELFGLDKKLTRRIFTEDHARDSYQNVLFPLLSFPFYVANVRLRLEEKEWAPPPVSPQPLVWRREDSPRPPKHITIISHAFKRERFVKLHLPAVGWPTDAAHLEYLGIDPTMNREREAAILEGDMKKGFGPWQSDLYGTHGDLLKKRLARGWSQNTHKHTRQSIDAAWHEADSAYLRRLLDWRGGKRGVDVYPGALPWRPGGLNSTEMDRVYGRGGDVWLKENPHSSGQLAM